MPVDGGHPISRKVSEAPAFADPEPLCGEVEFGQELRELALSEAPRLFAVMQETGSGRTGGLPRGGWRSRTIVGVGGHRRMRVPSPERALRWFGRQPDVTARLVWVTGGQTGVP
ncbi:hypothetical protein LHJ74_32400 [Streptomyces sp. N2-109]|uniref:Uncharacterized protein n=1 Tax=Streptomyces gossypii TaxID=2883101 RepID=A0ABT2K385_9ACTN|nr:hypothetical protein [Streptomyces gossypii]MCT2594556.1 hypothetical protein [Streptomyces gossypii]